MIMASAVGTVSDANCIFCRIVNGKEKNEIFYQDDEIMIFADIRPASKHHLLVIPKEHIKDAKCMDSSKIPLFDKMVEAGNRVMDEKLTGDSIELSSVSRRLGFHWPPFHTVAHLHLHVIAPENQMGFVSRLIFRPNSMWFVTPQYARDWILANKKKAEAPAEK